MLEDSITSSPSKSNKSIHERRLIRKNKRKKADKVLPNKSDHHMQSTSRHITIHDFYHDYEKETTDSESKNSTFMVAKPSAIIKDYKPFQKEKALAMADHISMHQKINENKSIIWPETQGFLTCLNLTELEKENPNDFSENKSNTSFSITESQLISCCHNAEKTLEKDNANTTREELTPKKEYDMLLVNTILEDFSLSPLKEGQIIMNTSYQHTPEFRLRRIPMKTYNSCKFKNTTKTNLNTRFEELANTESEDEDDDHSNCSSLSVQEDVAMAELLNNQRQTTMTNTKDFHGFPSNSDVESDNIDIVDNNEVNIMQTTLTHDLSAVDTSVMDTSFNAEEVFDDDCQDVLAGINTEAILQNVEALNNVEETAKELTTSLVPKDTEKPAEIEHIPQYTIGFKTASSKPIKVSREAHIMAAKILSKLPEIPQKNFELTNCDKKALNKDVNIFENPENYEWNDDCDLFLNIQTPVALNEPQQQQQQQQINTNELQHKPATNSLGFKTAGGKNVHVSKKAQESVQKLLEEFTSNVPHDHFDCEKELKELKCKVYAKTHNLDHKRSSLSHMEERKSTNELQEFEMEQVLPSTSKMTSIGFQTAGGKSVHISRKAQESVQKLLEEFTSNVAHDHFDCEKELKELKSKVYAKTHNLDHKRSSLSHMEERKSTNELKEFEKEQILPSTSKMASIGFHTAGGKSVNISRKAQESVQNLLEEFTSNVPHDHFDCEKELKEMKSKVYAKAHNIDHKRSSLSHMEESKSTHEMQKFEKILPSTSKMTSIGFQTAGGKSVHISRKAQESVQKLLKEFTSSDDPQDNFNYEEQLKEMKSKVYAKSHNFESKEYAFKDNDHKMSLQTQENAEKMLNEICMEAEENFENTKYLPKEYKENLTLKEEPRNIMKNIGFQTAKGREITVSAKAQKTVEKLLQDFNTDLDIEKFEFDLIEMKTKMQIKHKELQYNNDQLKSSQTNVNDNKDLTPKPNKRKKLIDNNVTASPECSSTPPAKILSKDLPNLRLSSSSYNEQPLTTPRSPQTVISRKNLLSLSKRHRNKRNSLTMKREEIPKINKEKYDINVNASTPIKTSVSLAINTQTPATPNLKEFISNAATTSTPRINITTESPHTLKDTDFKPINWKDNQSITNISANNTSTHTTKLSESSSLNITLNSSNPTAQERIGRLKMYGKPPDFSPILIETRHSCRPSGLRRTRSMLKKTEN
ncbi:uncharacterized protein LOC111679614 isoform X2 [Lucilia cuprina]|uniref:uncharacterized protein LOC111679614 isoform X2 n=1 Tax=Lucilia cuprina TaxID=7375 RepID=UPI001F05A420|nr:uncharacterized protein LOC111679614 isoform X2 [Lucilia cuprina]